MVGVEGKNRDKSQRSMILRKIKDKTVSLELVNLKSNTIFELPIEFCVSWNTKKLLLSKYEGNDKHDTENIIIDKTSLSKKS